ncbi:hypothetical protein Glove_221g32 [Diversispora epigaea]|uniref:C2H2-type domain-containing protein n=1 Tax=Diversispora epigaea TaxID=1348612 RepID=A0A397II49_9GLOM|nr:hypothetical protein Glove_221g32 [Diversispora epigaea]
MTNSITKITSLTSILPCNNQLECKICEKIYKRLSALIRHKKIIQDANVIKPIVYILPKRAIEETCQALVYYIKEKLKQHSRHVGNVNIIFSYTESQFFELGVKYFSQYQKTFVLFHQTLSIPSDSDPLQELQKSNPFLKPDSLQNQKLICIRKKIQKLKPIQIIIG